MGTVTVELGVFSVFSRTHESLIEVIHLSLGDMEAVLRWTYNETVYDCPINPVADSLKGRDLVLLSINHTCCCSTNLEYFRACKGK